MKLYKEMLRRLMPVGLPLLIVTMIYTLVQGGSDCFGAYYLHQSTNAISQVPVLRYYVFAAIFFALYGYSFQFSRAASDVYHSLPVKRTDLYVSVLLASASWMGATILLNVLEMLFILLVSGCPFVPVYIPLSVLFYFVASMQVFAAAAIGCAVSGTVLTALASTGIILLLPRYIQFLFARGIVERVPIIGWMDFGAMLDPTTNAATGILTMHLRNVYSGHLITMPHILYSLLLAAVMLGAAWWLFKRRKSEIAEKNGGYRKWTVASAVMLAFAVLLPITMNYQKLFSVYGLVLMAAALGVFVVYQLIVSVKIKKALVTLPFFAIAVAAVFAFSGLIQTASDSMLDAVPAAGEIESVSFRGYDYKAGEPAYSTIQTRDIEFTDETTKEFIAAALQQAVDHLQSDDEEYYYEYNRLKVIEPITIKLSGGRTIKRTIEFDNVDVLNALRLENEDYAKAVREFPPIESVQSLNVANEFTEEEEHAILVLYMQEANKNNLLSDSYYRDRAMDILPTNDYIPQGENQTLTGIGVTGYVGDQRYSDNYSLRLNTPDTVSLYMRTNNIYASDAPVETLLALIRQIDEGDADERDYLSMSISVYNYQNADGYIVQDSVNFGINQYSLQSEYRYDVLQQEYLHKFAEAIVPAVVTDDPSGLFLRLDWSYYDESAEDEDDSYLRQTVFLHFEDETSEQEFLTLMDDWESVRSTL